jgi:hypothetical protein
VISYNGVDLSVWTPEAAAWAERHIPLDKIFPQKPEWPARTPQSIPWPTPWTPPEVKIGVYTCPIGLSRWGTYYGIVNKTQLDSIRQFANGFNPSVTAYAPGTLVISDGRPASRVKVLMWMLEPVQLSGISDELFLLVLVDYRYNLSTQTVIAPQLDGKLLGNWTDLLNSVAGNYSLDYNGDGIYNLTADQIPAAYGKPTEKWTFPRPVPKAAYLDAIANAVNMRWIFDPYQYAFTDIQYGGYAILSGSGTIGSSKAISSEHTYNFQTETSPACVAPAPTEVPDTTSNTSNYFGWGTTFESNAGRQSLLCKRMAGSLVNATDLKATVPGSITVTSVSTRTTWTLAQIVSAGYVPELDRTGTNYYGNLEIFVDVPLLTTAQEKQIAGDFYGWYRANADITWPGIVRPKFSGHALAIEWTHRQDMLMTRYIKYPREVSPLGHNQDELNQYGLFNRPELVVINGAREGDQGVNDWYPCLAVGVYPNIVSPDPSPYPDPIYTPRVGVYPPSPGNQKMAGFVIPAQLSKGFGVDPLVVAIPVPVGGVDQPGWLEQGQIYWAIRTRPRSDGTPQWIAYRPLTRPLWIPTNIPSDGKVFLSGSGTVLDPYYVQFDVFAGRVEYTDADPDTDV